MLLQEEEEEEEEEVPGSPQEGQQDPGWSWAGQERCGQS